MAAYRSLTDLELVDLLKSGDEAAFTEIYNRYWDKLLSVAVNRLNAEEEAEECVQDLFLSVWRRREMLTLRYSLSTYLWVAIKYQVINRLDKRYARRSLKTTELTDLDSLITPSQEAYMLERELAETVEATISRLPEKCRIVYCMSREEGKSHREIADELQIAEKTVEGHMTRALKDIRTNLTSVAPAFIIGQLLEELHKKI